MDTQETTTSPAPAPSAPEPRPITKATSGAKAGAKPKKERKAPDPTDVELRFTGDPNVAIRGVPARDLRQVDVDRITYRRTISRPGGRGLHRGQSGFSQARAKVVRELTTTGKFKKRS